MKQNKLSTDALIERAFEHEREALSAPNMAPSSRLLERLEQSALAGATHPMKAIGTAPKVFFGTAWKLLSVAAIIGIVGVTSWLITGREKTGMPTSIMRPSKTLSHDSIQESENPRPVTLPAKAESGASTTHKAIGTSAVPQIELDYHTGRLTDSAFEAFLEHTNTITIDRRDSARTTVSRKRAR
jgi:hypothetical protein